MVASPAVLVLWAFLLEKVSGAEAMTVWLKKPWGVGVVTVIYIYSLSRHLGGCYPGGLCGSSLKHTHLFFSTPSINTHWLTLIQPHKGCESCALLTVKTGWVDAGTWMPSGIKHYYTFETLLRQRRLCTGTELSRIKKIKNKKSNLEKVHQIKLELRLSCWNTIFTRAQVTNMNAYWY